MFKKLKEKLKNTLSLFSKKTVEEAEDISEEEFKADLEKEEVKKEIEKEIEKKEKPKEIPKPEPIPQVPEEKPKSFLAKAKEIITTKKISEKKFNELFWDLELALLENNVSVVIIEKIKKDLKKELVDKPLPRNVPQKIQETLKKSLQEILTIEPINLIEKIKTKKPFVITFFGINGSGKTTTIAKIAKLLQDNKLTSVFAASDTFRAAAIDQLEEHAQKLSIKTIKHDYGADAAAVAFDAVKYAQKHNINAVLVDTAGRLHSDINLMDELKKICRVIKPDLKIFVGESLTGNDCVEQAQRFNEHIGIDALILTKVDVDEKGGAALSLCQVTKKPIIYIGLGQKYKDLKEFTPSLVLENLGLENE